MSLATSILGAPELENTRHNKPVNNVNTGDCYVFYRIEIYQRKSCQTAGTLYFMATGSSSAFR